MGVDLPIRDCYRVADGFLAGAYPGSADPEEAGRRLRTFARYGVDVFLDLTHPADPLEPYAQLLGTRARYVEPQYSTHVYLETDKGTIQIELAVLDAPLTVHNFVRLARKGYFDGLAFHRVVPDFVVQDGDPRGDGNGSPGYTIRDEINQRPYLRGTVGMALDWEDTGGSQYFITHGPQPHLDGRYTVFGQVVSGMEAVDALARGDVVRHVRVWDGTVP